MDSIKLIVPVNGTDTTFEFKKPDFPTLKAAYRCIATTSDKVSAGEILVANCGKDTAALDADASAKLAVCIELFDQVNSSIPEVKASTT